MSFFVFLLRPVLRSRAEAQTDPYRTGGGALALTPDGAVLLAVNPDSNSVSLINPTTNQRIIEIPVGLDPRAAAIDPSGAFAYVANRGADQIAVLDLSSMAIIHRIPTGDRPLGVAVSPVDNLLAVAEFGADSIRILETTTLTTLALIPVNDRPHGLAFTPDGGKLLVSHLLDGALTEITLHLNCQYLPLISHRTLGAGLHALVAPCQPSATHSTRTVTTWPNVAPAPAVIPSADGTRAYVPQTMANSLGLNTQFDTSVFPKVSVINLTTFSHQLSEHISLPEIVQPVGLPWDGALHPEEAELWIVNAASNDVSVVDITLPENPSRAANIPVGDNPRGIVFSPDGAAAYVNNILAGTISVIDTQAYSVTTVITSTEIPLPPLLLHGKRLFFSSATSDLAQASWISCATCHIEGEHDGRSWQLQYLGEVPPGATPLIPRNTTSLLGMIDTYPLRWSAEWDESADSEFSVRFEQFGSGLINDGDMHPTLGTPNQGRSFDLDALAAYIDSLASPSRIHTLTPAEVRGRDLFNSATTECALCHPAPLYTDLQTHDVGTAEGENEWFGPLIDTPSLRYLYDSAPYLHDGSASTLYETLTSKNPDDLHGVTSHLTEAERQDLVSFLLALPYH